jgi:hypothetical protein
LPFPLFLFFPWLSVIPAQAGIHAAFCVDAGMIFEVWFLRLLRPVGSRLRGNDSDALVKVITPLDLPIGKI